jgi:hypothetical protein
MARGAVVTRPDSDLVQPSGALVRRALAAAALIVGQQVAAKATRDALFLSTFPVTALPVVSGAAAALSLASVLAFSRGMARSSPPVMLRRLLAASAVLLLAEWALSQGALRAAAAAVYVHVALFGATLVSGFWSVVNERFDPRAARRLIGRIGTGAALGGVLGGVLTWRAATVIDLPTMLLVLCSLTLASLLALHRLDAPAPPSAARGPVPSASGVSGALAIISRNAYLRDVALVVALFAAIEGLLDYVLSAGVAARFGPGAPLTSFFALYHAAIGLLALGMQAVFVRRSLEKLGLAGTLAVPPAVVALGGLASSLVPGLWPRVALRGAQAVLGHSLFRSAYELLYTPVPPDRKRPSKALLDVGADRAGTLAASAAVLLALMVPGAGATRVLILLSSGLAVVVLLLTRRLHRGYVDALADSLRTGALRLEAEEAIDPAARAALAARPPEVPAPAPVPRGLAEEVENLRSGDPARLREMLTRDRPLPPELVPLAIRLLGRDDLFTEAVTSLRRVAARCTGQLVDVLLDPGEDPVVRRRVPRVLKRIPTQRAVDGLLIALRDDRFDIRYRSAQALLRLRSRGGPLSLPAGEALAAAQRELALAPSERALDHVIGLLSLALPGEPLPVALRAWRSADPALRGTALEYLENVLPSAAWEGLWPWLGARPRASSRTLDAVRDDLLRSTRSWTIARRSRSGPG